MKKIVLIILFSLSVLVNYAQQTVKGTVSSGKDPLQGVSVYEKDITSNGTITDSKGQFQLTLRGKGTLVFQSVGYLAKEVDATTNTQLNITLDVDAKGMEDVVVVAYGQKKKIVLTAAVSSISGDEIRQTPTASLQNALIGRVTGITTQQRSGRPGADGGRVLIRGLSSMGGGDNAGAPMVLVDDLEYKGSLSEIDPDQIESFTILKDAASTAVFGIKGANGVIVITTRRGKNGKPRITLRSESAGQRPTYLPKYLDSYGSALLYNKAQANDNDVTPVPNFTPRYSATDLELFQNGKDPYGHPNVDWADLLLRKFSVQTNTNLNISGGTDKVKYFISAGYLFQDGMVKDFSDNKDLKSNYYYKRYSFRSNLDFIATKSLTLNVDLSGNFAENNEPNIIGRNNRNNIFFEISDYNQLPPFAYNPYNPDGSYGSNNTVGNYSNSIIGRIALGGYRRFFDNTATANLRATQKLDFITRGLSLRAIVGYNGQFRFRRDLTRTEFPSFMYNATTNTYTPFSPTVYRIEKLSTNYSPDAANAVKRLNTQASLNYDRTFNGHHITALALFNQTGEETGANIPYYFRGFSFRTGYEFRQKYLVELLAGYNGSSKFSSANRYSWFPAVSAGWNISEEKFFKNAFPFFDLFKLRGSIGLNGTDDLATGTSYTYQQIYSRSGSYSIGDVSSTVNGIVEGTLGTDVTWEKERQVDVGVDLKMFKGKLSITADYFDKYRYDILIVRNSVSSILGVGLPPVNLGEVQNRGYEVEVGYADRIRNFNYSVRANISVAKNKVLYMDEAQPAFPWLNKTGKPLGTIAGYHFLGYYQDAADVAASAKPAGLIPNPGDLKYEDLNKDGIIDASDLRILPYPNLPSTILGFTGTASYKGFSIAFTLQSALNFSNRKIAESINPFGNNFRQIHANYWTPDNPNPDFPRLSLASNINNAGTYPSDYWFRRTDYLRVKSFQFGYDLPKRLMDKLSIQGCRIYTSGYNLLTWMLKEKNIYEVDPETPSGTEGGDYPVQKIINVGIQITF